MVKQESPYPLRLEHTLAKKLKYLANKNIRSYNKEIEFILKNYMAIYEEEYGEVVVEEE
ncbi:TraY domain-containing protein [Clostridiaceae bacterium NSJ-31]|uniref:TraY domain-containing protein n=1 Tax=Ligaoa zhengdingensis TaxID=2763658 RepID=A0A926DYT8_9FIRM|nr:TraY domain-containing protein [Ligaoa zhengdingensis]MBC8546596.1 TraY domain-containing protein [Ligaoa zhengdingensis]